MTHRSIRAATIAAAIAIAAIGLAACGSTTAKTTAAAKTTPAARTTPAAKTTTAAAAHGPATVAVTLSEFKITPAVARVAAGSVTFVVTNAGKIKHQFTIIRTDKPAAAVLSKHNPDDDIPGARGEVSSLAPGATKKLVVKDLKPGHYALVCALPGHYQAGMYADFTVG
ncbi:MAG TPA: cupredoxin domain-containing protein [Conexibacter sp.]|nr:cupredoxin domain-containing protein [Conexibacter sp.]